MLKSPLSGKQFTDNDFDTAKPSVSFRWSAVKFASNYRFEIKNSSGKVIFAKNLKKPEYVLSDKISVIADDGNYTWEVTAQNKAGGTVNKSKTASGSFSVKLQDVGGVKIDSSDLITVN